MGGKRNKKRGRRAAVSQEPNGETDKQVVMMDYWSTMWISRNSKIGCEMQFLVLVCTVELSLSKGRSEHRMFMNAVLNSESQPGIQIMS